MFWKNYEALCRSVGSSPTAIALELGFSNASATKWKKGSIPNGTTLQKIADRFQVSVSYLLGDEQAAPRSKGIRIPVLGNVAAGIPVEAITDIEDYEEITPELAASGEYVALRIHGGSMEPRMVDGDVVIVRIQDTAETGDIAVVMVDGSEATCKRVKLTPEGIMLIPLNPDYEPMFYTVEQCENLPVRIFGKVVELRAKF